MMKDTEKILVIIPTYNEANNIRTLLPLILQKHRDIDVLVVDDNSSDGTAANVKSLKDKFGERIQLIERPRKLGLGTAYVTGFKFALERAYDLIFEMDADFSHDPEMLPEFLRQIKDYDLVIGSRYISGVNVVNWPMSRLLLSWGANLYTRIVTGMPIRDATSGFKCFRREALEAIDLDKIDSDGYSFQIEMHFKVWRKNFRVKEIPIIFIDRCEGESKMHSGIVREAVWMVWKLRIQSLLGKL